MKQTVPVATTKTVIVSEELTSIKRDQNIQKLYQFLQSEAKTRHNIK